MKLLVIDRSSSLTDPDWDGEQQDMMDRRFVGLDVSKDETAIWVKGSDGRMAVTLKKPTDPDAIVTTLLSGDGHRAHGKLVLP